MILQPIIEHLYDVPVDRLDHDEARDVVQQLKEELNTGNVRAAEPVQGDWRVNHWVKKGILLAFRIGTLMEFPNGTSQSWFDKNTLGLRSFTTDDKVRLVPGGSAIRDGAFVAAGTVLMPPSYVNIGAYIDRGTLIDSHALVGSCAQIGRRVHLSAAAQVGGVLEPIGSMPVILEDDVFVGGNCGIYEGAIVRSRAVIAAGVILTGSTPVYDLVRNVIYRKSENHPLIIPEGAVVVPGNRHIDAPFAKEHHLSLYTPIIVKYRDAKTDAGSALEECLR